MRKFFLSFPKRFLVFLIIFIFIISYLFTVKNIFKGNEIDVLPVAKQFMDKNWLPYDWYLNLNHGYRMLFNILAGSMTLFMPIWLVALTGRFVIALFFSYFICKFSELFNIKLGFTLIFLYIWLSYFDTLVAKEWILKGFDTKTFAYISALFSFYYLYKNDHIKVLLFSGLAVSFHVLVGLYSFFCLFVTAFFNYKSLDLNLKKFIKFSFIFVVSSFFGILSIVENILDNNSIDKKFASLIYTTFRVPHHVMPSHWQNKEWLVIFILIVIFFIFVTLFYKNDKLKVLSVYALSSAFIFLIGLVVFALKRYELLKYYFFRHADVILPLFFIFTSVFIFQNLVNFLLNRNFKNFYPIYNLIIYMLVVFFTFSAIKNLIYFVKVRIDKKSLMLYTTNDKELEKSLSYIRDNIEKDAVLLSFPEIEEIYIAADRAVFVSIKHCPQKEKDIIEWYNRLKFCNDDIEVKDISDVTLNIEKRFYNLRYETIEKIKNRYKVDYYLGKPNKGYPYKVVYQNSNYSLYRLK